MIATPVARVVDASVAIKLVITEVLSAEAHALFAHLARDPAARFAAPELLDTECANILWKQVQRAGYPLVDAQQNLATLAALAVQRLPARGLVADALTLAARHGISVYDASYVAAAHQLGLPLITADARLVTKLAGTPTPALLLGSVILPPPPP